MAEEHIEENPLTILWGQPIRQGRRLVNEGGGIGRNLFGGWVPTSHDFTVGLGYYLEYRNNPDNDNIGYKDWLIGQGYGKYFDFVAKPNEFALDNQDIDFIETLYRYQPLNNPNEQVLQFLNNYRINAINNFNQEWEWNGFPKYLMDTYLCGQLAAYQNDQESAGILVELSYAGTINAAKAILTVGKSFGRHFGFLDVYYNPTQLYNDFFLNME